MADITQLLNEEDRIENTTTGETHIVTSVSDRSIGIDGMTFSPSQVATQIEGDDVHVIPAEEA